MTLVLFFRNVGSINEKMRTLSAFCDGGYEGINGKVRHQVFEVLLRGRCNAELCMCLH